MRVVGAECINKAIYQLYKPCVQDATVSMFSTLEFVYLRDYSFSVLYNSYTCQQSTRGLWICIVNERGDA